MTKPSKPANRITQDGFYRLCKVVETLRPEIESGKYATRSILLDQIQKTTGAILLPEQLDRALKTTGINAAFRAHIGITTGGTIVKTRSAILLLRATLRDLAVSLGVPSPLLDDVVFEELKVEAVKSANRNG